LEAPAHEFILPHQEQGFLVTSPMMSEASLPDEQQQQAPSASGATRTGAAGSMDSVEYSHSQHGSGHHSNGRPSRTNSGGSTVAFRGPPQSSVVTISSGQYQLSVATFHKRNQDTNSFRTGQQFLIKLDLKSAAGEPFKSPMSLILPRRMIQGHQKARQTDTTAAAGTHADSTSTATTASTSTGQDPAAPSQPQDIPAVLAGDPESHFYLEVTVHLASSEAIVQACPECCHKVRASKHKVQSPITVKG
ncbi:hypothetical protein EDD21DRAFT_384273, partial [Dissophora ornata]